MKFQAAFLKPISDRTQHFLGLPLTPAMDDSIVRLTFEWDAWKIPLHPHVKRIMQEEIGEQRTHDPALRRAFRSRLHGSIWNCIAAEAVWKVLRSD